MAVVLEAKLPRMKSSTMRYECHGRVQKQSFTQVKNLMAPPGVRFLSNFPQACRAKSQTGPASFVLIGLCKPCLISAQTSLDAAGCFFGLPDQVRNFLIRGNFNNYLNPLLGLEPLINQVTYYLFYNINIPQILFIR